MGWLQRKRDLQLLSWLSSLVLVQFRHSPRFLSPSLSPRSPPPLFLFLCSLPPARHGLQRKGENERNTVLVIQRQQRTKQDVRERENELD